MTPNKHSPSRNGSQIQHRLALVTLLFTLATATSALAQDAQTETRRHQTAVHAVTPAESAAAVAPTATASITARTWLDTQASGSMASPHKQTLNGPIMSRVYQHLLKQLSGKGNASGDANAESDSDNKNNAAGDLLKGLGDLKP
jgi:hypothetical protein